MFGNIIASAVLGWPMIAAIWAAVLFVVTSVNEVYIYGALFIGVVVNALWLWCLSAVEIR